MASVPLRRDRYLGALMAASPTMAPEVRRAVPVACALALTARSDGSHASLSGAQLVTLYGYGDGRSDATARRHLKALVEAGWLVQMQRGGRRGRKVFASIYGLSQPLTQMSARDSAPNRSRLTLQPLTQMSASSPERTKADGRPLPASPSRDAHRALSRAEIVEEWHAFARGEREPVDSDSVAKVLAWAADGGAKPDLLAALRDAGEVALSQDAVQSRATPPAAS